MPESFQYLMLSGSVIVAGFFFFSLKGKYQAGHNEQAGNTKSLSDLNQDESGIVTEISASCTGQQRRRLMDLGIVPGTQITAELISTGGDPVAYKIRDTLIALRREHAKLIYIK